MNIYYRRFTKDISILLLVNLIESEPPRLYRLSRDTSKGREANNVQKLY